jgi:soluble lytic murein transglycosylase-like protein
MNFGMIIASKRLDQVEKEKEVYMSTGDHLTIKDYFDRVFAGKQRKRTIGSGSAKRANTFRSGAFQGMLASLQTQGFRNANDKPAGLTIVDYLANPIRLIGRHPRPAELSCSETKANSSCEPNLSAAAKALSGKGTSTSPSDGKRVSSPPLPAVMTSREKSDTRERHEIERSVQKAAKKYNLTPGFIKGVIRAESNFQVDAVSRAGALGLMQLMPATAKELGVSNPLDIDQNIDGGCRYLRKMLDSFGGDVKLALAAYNAGPGTVKRYAGKVPYPETIQYVNRVLRYSEQTV